MYKIFTKLMSATTYYKQQQQQQSYNKLIMIIGVKNSHCQAKRLSAESAGQKHMKIDKLVESVMTNSDINTNARYFRCY
jgi:hypothetical protein